MKKKWISLATAIVIFGAVPIASAANQLTIIIHGKTVSTNETVKLVDGQALVPVRTIAEYLGQDVHWDPVSNTVTVKEKAAKGPIEMLVQRGSDSFDTKVFENAEKALIHNLTSLYNGAYRGLLTDQDSEASIVTSDKLDFLGPGEKGKKDQLSEHHVHIRLIQPSYIPQIGENAPAVKDILFFVDEREPDDLLIGAQNPLNLDEWKLFKAKDYGKWFQKEIDLYIRSTSGL